jgi:hypothetical protein
MTYNGTGGSGDLSNLAITNIQDKIYGSESEWPLWGVENIEGFLAGDGNLIWGMVSSEYETNPNVSTVRQPYLYLPGFVGLDATILGAAGGDWENLPGSDFVSSALATAYCVSTGGEDCGTGPDYSGQTNLALFARWQGLTSSAETASLIPNLIFADTAASLIVGTKGVFGTGTSGLQNNKAAGSSSVVVPVSPIVSRVRYRLPFAVPAILTLFLLLLATLLACAAAAFSGASLARLRLRLRQTSVGRAWTIFLGTPGADLRAGSAEWNARFGARVVDLSGAEPLLGEEGEEDQGQAGGKNGKEFNGDVTNGAGVKNGTEARVDEKAKGKDK